MFYRNYAAAAMTMALAGMASGIEQHDRSRKLADLEAKVADLEARRAAGHNELAATVDAVLRDAERRSRILANNGELTAGYDDGFFIRSGNFEFRPSIATIFRSTTSWVNDDANHPDGWQNGFSIRRIELEFAGTIISPNLAYCFVWKTPANGGEPELDEAFAQYSFSGSPWAIKAGQFNDDVYHEFTAGFKRQLAAEKSLMNEVLMEGAFDKVQGVAVLFAEDARPVRFNVALHDGALSQNTPFVDSPADVAALEYFGVSGRVEWKATGGWKDYRDFTARNTRESLLVIGAGTDLTQGQFSDGTADAVGGDRAFSALDVQWELPSPAIGLFAAITSDYTSFRDSGIGDDRLNWGALAQAGWAIDRHWEIFARYDLTKLDGDFRPSYTEDAFHEITAGVNYYLGKDGNAGHRAKITVDVGFLPNGSPIRATNLGIPTATDQEMLYIRAQLQLVI